MNSNTSLLTTLICGLAAASSHAITIIGLGTNGTLYSFDTTTPHIFSLIGTPENGISDIDFRGSNGKLYGINGSGAMFTLSLSTGNATSVSTPGTTLNGMVSGFDVNPVADRFRIVTNAEAGSNNYRLSSPGADSSVVDDDGTFATRVILDVAYTNPFSGGSTTLYSIVSDGNLYSHSGTPGFNTMVSSGNLEIQLESDIAFDIGEDGFGYLANGTLLYRINNVGVAAPDVVFLGTLAQPLSSMSAVPEPSTALLASLAALGLIRRRR